MLAKAFNGVKEFHVDGLRMNAGSVIEEYTGNNLNKNAYSKAKFSNI